MVRHEVIIVTAAGWEFSVALYAAAKGMAYGLCATIESNIWFTMVVIHSREQVLFDVSDEVLPINGIVGIAAPVTAKTKAAAAVMRVDFIVAVNDYGIWKYTKVADNLDIRLWK